MGYSKTNLRYQNLNLYVKKGITIIIVAFFCLSGVRLIFQITPYGLGINGDSYQYIAGANTLATGYGIGHLDGAGIFKPLTHYPPFLSIILTGLKLTGMETRDAAQNLNAFLFGLDILLVAIIVNKTTRSLAFALIGAGLFLISPEMIRVHTWIFSEPTFLFLELIGFLAMTIYLEKYKFGWLIISSIALGLAILTRYPGIVLIATAAIALFLTYGTNLKWKFQKLAIFILLSCTPIVIWLVRNYFLVGNATNRRIQWHPLTKIQRHEGIDTVLGWIFPADFIYHKEEILVFVFIVIGIVAAIFWLSTYCRRENKQYIWPNPGIRFLFSLLVIMYIGFLIFSISLIDVSTPLDYRILSPVHSAVIILLVTFLADLWEKIRFPFQVFIVVVIVYLFIFLSGVTMRIIPEIQSSGQGFAHLSWKNSPVIRGLSDFPNASIYTNQIAGIYVWTERGSWSIPWKYKRGDTEVSPTYQEELDMMRERLKTGAILVLYRPENMTEDRFSVSDLIQGLTLAESFPDGAIYKYNP